MTEAVSADAVQTTPAVVPRFANREPIGWGELENGGNALAVRLTEYAR